MPAAKKTRRPSNRVRSQSLRLETLEDRRLLASFGTPWPEPRELSISFPTDQASIGHYQNSIREVFDQVADRREWQAAALRAFQTWAAYANINVGLTPDRGDDFGSVGLSTNDPRFGEFRLGAFPQAGVLANAAPYQPTAGTWSGDVLLNTQANYFLGDWESDGPIDVPGANERGPAVELFSVLLHEAGNALGLADNNVPGSVMNGTYSGPRGQLSATDINAIRALYGARQDSFEESNNNSRHRATRINTPVGYSIAQPIVVPGSLNTKNDVDFYRFQPLANQEKVTVRLWSTGVSLLKAKLEVLDRYGNKIADAKADDIFANNLRLEIGSLEDYPTLFLRVARNTNDVFAIGDYRLEIDYRPESEQPSIHPPAHDADAEDDDDATPAHFVSIDALFSQAGILDPELGMNDTWDSSTDLATAPGFLDGTRYELTSSMAAAEDRDLWRFRAPDFNSPVMRLHVDPVGLETHQLEAILLNENGDRVASAVTRKADGGITLTVAEPTAGASYTLFVRSQAGSPVSSGNYVAIVDFATDTQSPAQQIYSASVAPNSEHFTELVVRKTQLFRFDLLASSNSLNHGVQLSIYHAKTNHLITTFAGAAAQQRSEYIWLSTGTYYIRAVGIASSGIFDDGIDFALSATALSDDQGPNPSDPSNPNPPSDYPNLNGSPLNPSQPPPLVNYEEPPFEDPWNSDDYFDLFLNYYFEFLF